MNPHLYNELSRVTSEQLDRAAQSYRHDFAPARPVARERKLRGTRAIRLGIARLRPATR